MGDSGDYWRDRDEYRRKQRAKMTKCLCGRKGFRGDTCFSCERIVGDDLKTISNSEGVSNGQD